MAKIKNPERMGSYQAAIDKLLVECGCKHLGVNVTPVLFQMFNLLIRYRNDSNSVSKGFLGNSCLMVPSDASLMIAFNI